jgi:hypothetical protein
MSMKPKDKGIKKFSKEENLAILVEGKRKGIKVTLAKYIFFNDVLLLVQEN